MLQLQNCSLNVLLTLCRSRYAAFDGIERAIFCQTWTIAWHSAKSIFHCDPLFLSLSLSPSHLHTHTHSLSLWQNLSHTFVCETRTCFLLSTSSKVKFSCYYSHGLHTHNFVLKVIKSFKNVRKSSKSKLSLKIRFRGLRKIAQIA